MSLYTVVVVDDEKWSIIDLLNSVAWNAHGFQIVAFFDRANEALESVVAHPPDLVFTDIRMPKMDGIKFMQEARGRGVESEFVVISAFADFNLARKAIDVGVVDYCLKPVNPENLAALLEKLKRKLDKRERPKEEPKVEILPEKTARIVSYLKEHFREEISLDSTAQLFNLNKNYLCALMKKNLGTTFSRYVATLRIELAKEYLAKTCVSIEETARNVGYEDYFYFCKVFKRIVGISPGRFRASLRMGCPEGDQG